MLFWTIIMPHSKTRQNIRPVISLRRETFFFFILLVYFYTDLGFRVRDKSIPWPVLKNIYMYDRHNLPAFPSFRSKLSLVNSENLTVSTKKMFGIFQKSINKNANIRDNATPYFSNLWRDFLSSICGRIDAKNVIVHNYIYGDHQSGTTPRTDCCL